ncbi:MAG: hypothetical protein KDC45_10050 [Bacteroidetes bacterium]|nr:hypothetical protein [Bacteroidota bacterium]
MVDEIQLRNIRIFDDRRFDFRQDLTDVSLGNVGGKSTLLDAVRCVLGMRNAPTVALVSGDPSEIVLKARFGGQSWTLFRSFDAMKTLRWSATSGVGSFDLKEANQLEEWRSIVLDDMALPNYGEAFSSAFVHEHFDRLLDLSIRASAPSQLVNEIIQLVHPDLLFHLAAIGDDIRGRAAEQLQSVKQRAVTERAGNSNSIRQFDLLKEIDGEIRTGEERLLQLEQTLQRDEDELRQGENIHQFVSAKRLEIQQLDFDIAQFELQLAKGDVTVEEPETISAKRSEFENLVLLEKDLDGRLREIHHLERNLRGISKEVRSLQKTGDTSKLSIYEEEIGHLRKLLTENKHVDKELERVRVRKAEVAAELGPWISVPNRSKEGELDTGQLVQKVEKCRGKKERIEQELEGINAAFYEERFKILEVRIFQHHQQIREQRQRLLDLDARRLEVLKGQTESTSDTQTSVIQKQRLESKRYLDVFAEVLRESSAGIRQDAISRLSDVLKTQLSPREMDVFNLIVRGYPDDQLPLSTSERLLVSEIIRAGGVCLLGAVRVIFVSELAARVLDQKQQARLREALKDFGNLQAVIFV